MPYQLPERTREGLAIQAPVGHRGIQIRVRPPSQEHGALRLDGDERSSPITSTSEPGGKVRDVARKKLRLGARYRQARHAKWNGS